MRLTGFYLAVLAVSAFGQSNTYPYYLKTFAGAFPLGDGGPATSALLYFPNAAVADAAGNLYILDTDNLRIRKVTAAGTIGTLAQIDMFGYDMKLAADGSLYVAGDSEVIKVGPSGTVSVVAGTGTYGHTGDNGPATAAQIGEVSGIALDGAGNIYLTEAYSTTTYDAYWVRMVTADGKIHTIAGAATGYGHSSDGTLATSAYLNNPTGIAIDSSGGIYIADTDNHQIRKFTVGGMLSTVAGTGVFGQPANGPAISTSLGYPMGLWMDSSNNLYAVDNGYGLVLKIAPGGGMTRIAGNFSLFGSPGDGTATNVSLEFPVNVSADSAGNLYIVDDSHLVRKLTLDGKLTTVAGRVHFGGDNGPAVSALLNEPTDVALAGQAGQANVFIADASNYRIRKVAADGTITSYSGNGTPGIPSSGTTAANAQLPYINSMTTDAKGAMYLAGNYQVWKIASDGTVSLVAGTGAYGSAGDGGQATAATFEQISGIALDASGDVYIADYGTNRVRAIAAATGIITPFAGSGTRGSAGNGALATSAQLNLDYSATPLAVDTAGNVYIADTGNYTVRMVSATGIITTAVGNGTFGRPDGVPANATGFSEAGSMAFDSAGNLYIASQNYGDIYRYQPSSKIIRRISGTGNSALTDGTPAISVNFFSDGIKVDQNGDIYAADSGNNAIRKLQVNTPTGFTITDGNYQTGQAGQSLSKVLKVQLGGRLGFGVSGVTVTYAVTSGSATLSAGSTVTDSAGMAGIGVTLGAGTGTVTIAATAAGTGLAPLQFTETAIPACTVPQPAIASVNTATDFGGSATFAPGSWLEIKGTNLSQTTRQWAGSDFNGASAPTSLDSVSVTIDGKSAYLAYISPGQINVQAPADTATGNVQVAVTTSSCSSTAFTVPEAAIAPGLLAPASFKVNGTQYLVAQFPDFATYVGNANLIPGVPFRPAAPGDTIIAYGIGFGAVAPAIAPGQVASGSTSLANLSIAFGSTPATVTYDGLVSGAVGLYQFQFMVPNVADGDYPIVFQVGSTPVAQTVYLTVHK
jgi:uncharacterized protein (TIGR03437 family)